MAVVSSASATSFVGRIYAEDGRPVDGALVTVQPTAATVSGLPWSRAVTDAQGKFTFDLADGEYSVCAVADQKGFLSSCEWDLAHSVVKVQSPLTQFKITLKPGITFRVRLNDPTGLLSKTAQSNNGAFLSFIVWDALGHSHYLRETGGDDKGKNLELLVPPDTSLRLTVQNNGVDVLGAGGASASRATVALVSMPSNVDDTRVYQVVPQVNAGPGKGK